MEEFRVEIGEWTLFLDKVPETDQASNRPPAGVDVHHLKHVGVPFWAPCSAHTALEAAGVIADPLVARNDLECRWVSHCGWRIESAVQVKEPPRRSAGPAENRRHAGDGVGGPTAREHHILLCFDGVDTIAEVEAEGVRVGRCDNMHRRWAFDITAIAALQSLAPVKFVVRFSSAVETAEAAAMQLDHPVPCMHYPHGSQHWNLMRKSAASFGWDWGPAIPSVGLWRGARVEVRAAKASIVNIRTSHGPVAVAEPPVPAFERGSGRIYFDDNDAWLDDNDDDDDGGGEDDDGGDDDEGKDAEHVAAAGTSPSAGALAGRRGNGRLLTASPRASPLRASGTPERVDVDVDVRVDVETRCGRGGSARSPLSVRVVAFAPGTDGASQAVWTPELDAMETAAAAEMTVFPRADGLIPATLRLNLPEARLWFPRGTGPQPLYRIWAVVTDESGRVLARRTRTLGVRTVELVRDPDPIEGGETFFVRVNGVDVFARGANWVPPHPFRERATDEHVRALLGAAAEANMNMVRVWGGGTYETDDFFDTCDALGLLVWMDAMFACAAYPADPAFLRSVEAELRDQVPRIAEHPCLALWCANNECEEALGASFEECRANVARYAGEYEALYRGVVEKVIREEDSETPFWTSSPSNGPWRWGDPQDTSVGDTHFWRVWHGDGDFSAYLDHRPRFCSEFGFCAFPSVASLSEAVGGDASQLNATAPLVEHRQRSPARGGNLQIIEHVARAFRFPHSFRHLTILSQALQAVSLRTAVEHWRRCKPYTMGAVYWQLNDTWCAPTWSTLEHDGTWKLAHYAARDFFSPVLLSGSFAPRSGGEAGGDGKPGSAAPPPRLHVWLTSDLAHPITGITVEVSLHAVADGAVLGRRAVDVGDLAGLDNRCIWDDATGEDIAAWNAGRTDDCVVALTAHAESPANLVIPRNFVFPEPFKNLNLQDPRMSWTVAFAAPRPGRHPAPGALAATARRGPAHALATVTSTSSLPTPSRGSRDSPSLATATATAEDGEGGAECLEIRLRAERLALFVTLELESGGSFSDQGFHMLAGEEIIVQYRPPEWSTIPPDEATRSLIVTSLRDTY